MTFEERFWSYVERGEGCWIWTASTRRGYGRTRRDGKTYQSHRMAYELLVGPIPAGLTLDHLCRNRACVNPDHLEPVTQRENLIRGTSPIAVNAAKSVCKRGHALTAENTYVYPRGHRSCRECQRWHDRERYANRRAQALERAAEGLARPLIFDWTGQ